MDEHEGNGLEPKSLHKYLYAANNPVDAVDPSGNLLEPIIALAEENAIGAEEDAFAIRIFQTAFRTTMYVGKEALYSAPTLLLRAAAALTALAVAASSVIGVINPTPGQLPDAAQAQAAEDDNLTPFKLFRDVDSTKQREFRWRGPDKDPDGLSFFEKPFGNPRAKRFSVGFKAKYVGRRIDGARGGFDEPELYGIGVVYTPNIGAGDQHWSAPVTQGDATSYEERFAAAAERIKNQGGLLPNPNPQ
jgi:hypothetical protein